MTSQIHGQTEIVFVLTSLSLIWTLPKVLNIFLKKIKLPSILGELGAGLVLASLLLFLPESSSIYQQVDFIKHSEVLKIIGELGIILLLFDVGLETDLKQIIQVGKESFLVAILGVLAPFLGAYLVSLGFDWSWNLTIFVGLVLAATSIGITARVFQDLGILNTVSARIVIGAAVIDDVLGLMLLSVIIGLVDSSKTTDLSFLSVLLILVKSVAFILLALLFNKTCANKIIPRFNSLTSTNEFDCLVWSLILCFATAFSAKALGLEPIIGAFAAGLALDKKAIKNLFGKETHLEKLIAPIRAFLAPVFFVKVGLEVVPSELLSGLALIMILVACIAKLVSGLIPVKTKMNRMLVGIGMVPRGEVGLVVAKIGVGIGLLHGELYSALLAAVIMTTLFAPIFLRFVVRTK